MSLRSKCTLQNALYVLAGTLSRALLSSGRVSGEQHGGGPQDYHGAWVYFYHTLRFGMLRTWCYDDL